MHEKQSNAIIRNGCKSYKIHKNIQMLIEHKREIGAKPVRSRHCDGEFAYKDVTGYIIWEDVSVIMILSQ